MSTTGALTAGATSSAATPANPAFVPAVMQPIRPRPLSPAFRQRLDRLALRAHRFHRFAHHPLCHEYSSEVVRIGRKTRLCRGCLLAAVGVTTGSVAALVVTLPASTQVALVMAAMALVLIAMKRRSSKIFSRFLPAVFLADTMTSAARLMLANDQPLALVLAGSALLAGGGLFALYRRRGPDRGPCQTCPDRAQSVSCRGMRPIVQRERALQRRTRSLMNNA